MFTEKAQLIIDAAKDRDFTLRREQVSVESLLAAIGQDNEAAVRLGECLCGGEVTRLRALCPEFGSPGPCPGTMRPDAALRRLLETACELAGSDGVPDRIHPGLVGVEHLVCATAMSAEAVELLGEEVSVIRREQALAYLAEWLSESARGVSLGELIGRLRGLRAELLSRVFGQDHAVHAVVEGLYAAEVTAPADRQRKRPKAVFVFAGPPGVGKTYLAELCAAHLKRPFQRFDMTAYSDHQAHNQLVGFAPSYRGAHPGLLTGFVKKNPDAVLLFDEIEKAHLTTIQLFYQILDAGRLEDKYTEEDVSFRDTIIIFTTNAGRSLYENPNRSGIAAANAGYHKQTILSALANEKNPADGRPAFPPAICSRLAQGYPVMFNHLDANELVRIADAEMRRTGNLLERQYFKAFGHDELVPLALVLRQGARVDARQLRSEAEQFVKAELFKFCSLFSGQRAEEVLEEADRVQFTLPDSERQRPEIAELFQPTDRPAVLLAADEGFIELCCRQVPEIRWVAARSPEEAAEQLAVEEVDLVLLDLWMGAGRTGGGAESAEWIDTRSAGFDHVPLAARTLDLGRRMLRLLHERFPQMPVYLLSLAGEPAGQQGEPTARRPTSIFQTIAMDARHGESGWPEPSGKSRRRAVDDELFLACVRAGGARGLVATNFGTPAAIDEASRQQFVAALREIALRLYRERVARRLARERKALVFETLSRIDPDRRVLEIRLRDLRLARAVDAADVGEVMSETERPATRFADVLGATEAKKALGFVVDWLRHPKRYAAMGLRPPKGVLLTGPPGTGKTMLARAVAGESDCAFCQASATSFVTIWQGSGPQNVRDLFQRARRYAPAIVFIDEIDAIGRQRTGGPGGRAEEETLDALLVEMDGFAAESGPPVIVLAATNLAEQLDEALKRRFDRIIEVDRPARADRLEYLRRAFEKRKNSKVSAELLQRLAEQSAGMTIANLERVVQEAGVTAAQEGRPIDDALLEDAFERIRMGEAKETPDPETLLRIARHEAGHTVIAWLGGNRPYQVTIVGRGAAGGYMERKPEEERIIYTKAELEQRICESMGGRAAEIVCYGSEQGLSSGVASDLQHATQLAVRMVSDFAMDDQIGHIALGELAGRDGTPGPMSEQVARAAERIVKQQLERAVSLLRENKPQLDRLVEALMEKDRLTEPELADLLD